MNTTIFTTEIIAVISVFIVLAAAIGFLIAKTLLSKVQARKEQELDGVQENLERLAAEYQALTSAQNETQDKFHESKIKQGKLETENESLVEKNESLKADFNNSQEKLSAAVDARHKAENSGQAAQAELKEKRNQIAELQERMNNVSDDLGNERNNLTAQKGRNADLDKQAKAFEVKAEETEKKYQEIKTQRDHLQNKFDELQKVHASQFAEYTELKTSLNERDKNHKVQLEQFDEQKKALTKEFENLANKIFEEKGRTFTDTSKSSIDTMLKPFREQIEGFQKRINDIHDESLKGNTSLNSEIKKVLDIGLKMSDEASNLTSALKGDSQQRGAWGEAQLKRTLEMSGLIEDAHYETQSAFKDLEGKQKQTDYLVKLPDNKHIIIDSKVSLIAYDKAVSAGTPEEHNLAMIEHIKAVKKHIDDLAMKDYTNLVGMRSPSFVLMFMPIEPAYIDALKSNKNLFSYGYEKGIVLVSHTTLIPILRTVANLWMMERSNVEAREISEKAGEIYNQVCVVAERLQKLGGTLSTVSNHYNNTVKAVVGQQGLHGKVERFGQLSNKVSKTMPALEPAHIDFETERLILAAEPIDDEAEKEACIENKNIEADEVN